MEGYYEKCTVLVVAKPGNDGMSDYFIRAGVALTKEKAEELSGKILLAGEIETENGWLHGGQVRKGAQK